MTDACQDFPRWVRPGTLLALCCRGECPRGPLLNKMCEMLLFELISVHGRRRKASKFERSPHLKGSDEKGAVPAGRNGTSLCCNLFVSSQMRAGISPASGVLFSKCPRDCLFFFLFFLLILHPLLPWYAFLQNNLVCQETFSLRHTPTLS